MSGTQPSPCRVVFYLLSSAVFLVFASQPASAQPRWPFLMDNDRDGYSEVRGDCNDRNPTIYPNADEICGDGIDQDCSGADLECPCTDQDGDGVCAENDCDDTNPNQYPGAEETCNGVDDDCDGVVDEGVLDTFFLDADADGYGDDFSTTEACAPPDGYSDIGGDCNDANPAIYPGAPETCDSLDNDCDGVVDNGAGGIIQYIDQDGDGYGSGSPVQDCSLLDGYVLNGDDCDDTDGAVYPGASETCDGIDNDCDGAVDEDLDLITSYPDLDEDGYGDETAALEDCRIPDGYTRTGGDCDDTDPWVNPGGQEVCDGTDNNCDGTVDEGLTTTYYLDADGDGYGAEATTEACDLPDGYAAVSGDCDDADAGTYPGAPEACDGIDNDCDGAVDNGVETITQYFDADGDGYGAGTPIENCAMQEGYVTNADDCDDSDAAINPGASEVCDGTDNNCDGAVDEGVTNTYYLDADGDGYGVSSSTTQACTAPAGYAAVDGDCDDSNPATNPGASEVCDGEDNDCDGQVDDGAEVQVFYRDADGDGYGTPSSTTQACTAPEGYVAQGGDCDDTDAWVNPAAEEVCDGTDNNCNNQIDEGLETETYYQDADGDGYGALAIDSCDQPPGFVTQYGDCNDSDPAINPGATEVCDGVDNDCDYQIDEDFDADSDGYASCAGDCDDTDSSVHPGAWEICDGYDNDCDGEVDENLTRTYYRDADYDGYGDPNDSVESCVWVSGYVTVADDCDDSMWSVNPDGYEICNGYDDDCDGLIDATDVFDVTTGALGDFNSACDSYDRVAGIEIPYLKVSYTILGESSTLRFYDSVLVAGHDPGVNPPRGWPSTCTYYNDGIFWYSPGNPDATYSATLCLSPGTDEGGLDEVYLSVTYLGIDIKGTFDNEPDDDGLDGVYLSVDESDENVQVWYVSDTADSSGFGFTATMEIHDARVVAEVGP